MRDSEKRRSDNMEPLQQAIEKITYASKKFPQKEFKVITENKEGAIPYLRQAVEKAIRDSDELDENYQLHFYALFLLAEFQDREFFPKIMELASLPEEVLDYLIGDAVTEGLENILYNTYNGDLELMKNSIMDDGLYEYARSAMLKVMGQLYCDGTLSKEEWKAFIKQNVYSGEEYSQIYNVLGSVICQCHFIDMLPEIRFMLEHGLLDEMYLGKYDSCVDHMFQYRDYEQNFCESPINAANTLKSWSMFENEGTNNLQGASKKDFEKLFKASDRELNKPIVKKKIGRNDICPCGSGKKYKFCCMNKPQSPIDSVEDAQEREKALRDYPKNAKERQEGRIYLEDYFDSESIEIDKLLYLGIMHRPGLIWLRNEEVEENRTKAYLKLAFTRFQERVERERIQTFAEYDEKYSIHYLCEEWMNMLLDLLKKSGDKAEYLEVRKCCRKMRG